MSRSGYQNTDGSWKKGPKHKGICDTCNITKTYSSESVARMQATYHDMEKKHLAKGESGMYVVPADE